uniref:NB-ARC domain-containing protein n=1 Tax=Oryza punctata TaxID=4537 RepID=A0A0E0MKP0_ORYPU
MATSAAVVFAGKSVAAPVIKGIITRALNYLDGYLSAKSMDEMKNKLEEGMLQIQAVLDVVNPDHFQDHSVALDRWFWKLRDAVEEAEDAIDEIEYYELEEKAKDHKVSDWGSPLAKWKHKVVKSIKDISVLDKSVNQFTHHGTLKKLKKAMDGLDKAAAGTTKFLEVVRCLNGVTSSSQKLEHLPSSNDRQTGSMLTTDKFVGRESEKRRILEWLTKNTSVEESEIMPSANQIPIFSVVGHGGMGKTTLAQSICQQDEVVKHFMVIWITVSTSFDATSVTRKILESATREEPSNKHLEALQQDLKEKLNSVKFLLVMDDVWEEGKRDEWEKLFAPLRSGKNGSKILLTTRMASVADMAAKAMGVARDCLTLQGLEEDKNIELFNHHVFSGLNLQDYSHFRKTGEKIARKLGGCPLVIKVTCGHLQGNMTVEYWENFLHTHLEHFKGSDLDIMKVLKLSYQHLPTELQICFRFCSLFPEDHEFDKEDLVHMWMCSGLISQATSETLNFEDIGERILADLTRKSFFDLKSRVDRFGLEHEEYYVMHDLMHELARNVSFAECARITNPISFKDIRDTVRHICISCIPQFSIDVVKKISEIKNLRSIIIDITSMVDKDTMYTLQKIIESTKSLRLFRSRLEITFDFSSEFGKLKHLRYINIVDMSSKGIYHVAKLYHLLVLSFSDPTMVFPCHRSLLRAAKQERFMMNLYHLRHVACGFDMYSFFGMLPISKLESIRRLSIYHVKESGDNKVSSIRNLHCLRELDVIGLENIENHEEAIIAKLNEKQHLCSLSLEWSQHTDEHHIIDELVLHHLEPHTNIRKLRICGYKGRIVPFWIENLSVRNLVSIKLESCINWEQLPSLGELALLRYLLLRNLPKLQQIGLHSHMSSSSSMELLLPPSLQNLEITQCPKLQELPLLPPSLVSFVIRDVNCTKLPRIGKLRGESSGTILSHLQKVAINECPCLSSLEDSFFEQKQHMVTLRFLRIINCIHLESASMPFEAMNMLIYLDIDCAKLRAPRGAGEKFLPSSLKCLHIRSCGDYERTVFGSPQEQQLTNLYWLSLKNCSNLVSLPSAEAFSRNLTSLQNITIKGCENLSSLGGLGSLPSLSELQISCCGKLTKVGSSLNPYASGGEEEHPVDSRSSLRISSLYIDTSSLLLVEPLNSLCYTEHLVIGDASQMESLPDRWLLQNSASLKSLDIRNVKSFESLPPSMRDLTSLRYLELCGVGQLLGSLPDLPTSLLELVICQMGSELKKKFRKHGSLERNKIAHILRVRIGDSLFIMGKECYGETKNRLEFPLDFRTISYISRIVGLFGKLDYWQEVDAILGRVLLRVYFDDVDLVRRRIVLKQIPNHGGQDGHMITPVPLTILSPASPLAIMPLDEVPLLTAHVSNSIRVSQEVDEQPSSPVASISVALLLPKALVKKRDGKTVLYDPARRQSSRLRASSADCLDYLGESLRKKLKELAGISNVLSFGSVLKESDFESDIHSETDSSPSDCSISLLQKMGVQICGLSPEEVAEGKLGGDKLYLVPRPAEEDD